MVTSDRAEIRALLYKGEVEEIGHARHQAAPARVSPVKLALAFAAIYLIWGSTYLGIRYAIETIPPLLMMGMRNATAGTLLYLWARSRGTPAPTRQHWKYAAVAGALLFLCDHGLLAWGEQHVASGLAALCSATLPLWMVMMARFQGSERQLRPTTIAGLLLGFAGVALLVGTAALGGGGSEILGVAAVMVGIVIWALGTLYVRGVKMPESAVLSSGMQMMVGGYSLLLAGTLAGEAGRFHLGGVTMKSALSLAYLISFGSIIAFTAYMWLLRVSTPARISTYAYVNPVVAVLLGWGLAGEPVGWRTLAAMVVILAGVALVRRGTA
jgi:drug/metabolite transporter (DMT)-like permease